MTTYGDEESPTKDESNEPQVNPDKRIKLYKLNEQGTWDEKGCGHVSIQKSDDTNEMWIIIRSEVDQSILIRSVIKPDPEMYVRTDDIMILWIHEGSEVALSFQLESSCAEIWQNIQDIQNAMLLEGGNDFGPATMPLETITLPEPTLSNIKEIEQQLESAPRYIFFREQLVKAIKESEFLSRLLSLFSVCEDLESIEDLYSLGNILRSIIMLNDNSIFEFILRDETFEIVVGILEYDREYPHSTHIYRDHLKNKAKFKQVVPIPNPNVVVKIKQTFRVQFLKDVAMARLLDDASYSTLNSLILFNNVHIVNYFYQDEEYLGDVFKILSSDESAEKKKDVIMFLQELCMVAKSLDTENRASFYRALGQHGLFAIFDYTLQETDITVRLAVTSILYNVLDHDPTMLRSFCLIQLRDKQSTLIDLIIDRFLNENDAGLRLQLTEILRSILDTTTTQTLEAAQSLQTLNKEEQEANAEFLTRFYERFINKMTSSIVDLQPHFVQLKDGSQILRLTSHQTSVMNHVCDLLCFMIKQHSYHSKYYMLGSNIVQKLVFLFKSKDSYLRLSALRVIRTCVGTRDEFYNRHLIKYDVFGAVVGVLFDTKGKYNMINSACIELFEFIRTENIKTLINHIVPTYRSKLETFSYTEVFSALILKYDQTQEIPKTPNDHDMNQTNMLQMRKANDGFGRIDADEEAYFNSDDNEDESQKNNNTMMDEPDASPVTRHELDQHTSLSSPLERKISFVKSTSPLLSSPSKLVDYPDDDNDSNDIVDHDDKDQGGSRTLQLLQANNQTKSFRNESNNPMDIMNVMTPTELNPHLSNIINNHFDDNSINGTLSTETTTTSLSKESPTTKTDTLTTESITKASQDENIHNGMIGSGLKNKPEKVTKKLDIPSFEEEDDDENVFLKKKVVKKAPTVVIKSVDKRIREGEEDGSIPSHPLEPRSESPAPLKKQRST